MTLGLFIPTFKRDSNKVSASIWIRVFQMQEIYKNLGVHTSLNNFFKYYDVVIFYRSVEWWTPLFLWCLRLISKKVYFDTCVNYLDAEGPVTKKNVSHMKKILSLVDGVVTSSEYISNRYKKEGVKTFCMHDPINIDVFSQQKGEIDWENPLFVWSGVSVKFESVLEYAGFLKDRLLVISDREVNYPTRYTFMNWDFSSFPQDVLKGDIAFLPRDYKNAYDKGHSSFKALVFAVQGIPIIANKLDSYERLAKYYDGIVFLEDYQNIDEAIDELQTRSRSTKLVRQEYSRLEQGRRLLEYLNK